MVERRDEPLAGRRIVVTRASARQDSLLARLGALGADVVALPLIGTAPPGDGGAALAAAVDRLVSGHYAWMVIGSPTAAEVVAAALGDRREAASTAVEVCAVGPGTADALRRSGIAVALVPDRHIGEGVVEAFAALDRVDPVGRVLVPRAAVARDVIPDGLAAQGWDVEVVEAYRTVTVEPTVDELAHLDGCDAVTLTSSSTASRFADLVDRGVPQPPVVVCIGPITAATARERGLTGIVVTEASTLDHLVDTAVAALSGRADS